MTPLETSQKRTVGPFIRLHPNDNVMVARSDVPAGTAVPEENFITSAPIPAGHKVAARPLRAGDAFRKYDVIIGFAAADTAPGTYVHAHNIAFQDDFNRDYAYARDYRPIDLVPESARATFQGIVRADGRVATRNYVGVVSTVNCSATVTKKVAEYFTPERLAEYPNIDGVVPFTHGLGCAMEMTGEPMAILRRTLGGYIRHPNIAAALVIGLGCERNPISELFADERLTAGSALRTLVMQEAGGTRKSIEAGIAAVREMLPEANRAARQRVPASHIMVGLQCGGSDGFSSITANPALGAAVDILARHGGTAILSETAEIYGVEHTLTRRAATRAIGEKLIERIRWWKDEYSVGADTQINGRVTQGNVAGGLANILEKSLGSSMKGGTGPLMAVYRYAEPVMEKGLVFMDTPSFDPMSATGQVAGGANLVAFTTGRGSCFGSIPAPTLKLATNTPMYRRLEEDMDINCGEILDGGETIVSMGEKIFAAFLRIASGEKSKSEELGVGENEFIPWQAGVFN
jgi:arabinonate dehydratase